MLGMVQKGITVLNSEQAIERLKTIIPSFGTKLDQAPELFDQVQASTRTALQLN
jgi:hypothetical protein